MAKKIINTHADLSCLNDISDIVEGFLESCWCPGQTVKQILVSIEEVFVNIADYAYECQEEKDHKYCSIELENGTKENTGWVRIVIRDRGKPFDPLKREEVDISLSADEREIGGLGIHMVRNIMDDLSYEYKEDQNILTMIKGWNIN